MNVNFHSVIVLTPATNLFAAALNAAQKEGKNGHAKLSSAVLDYCDAPAHRRWGDADAFARGLIEIS